VDILNSKWAKEFKEESPSQYKKALKYATNKNIVFAIYQNDEIGEKLWAISYKGFWMDAFDTKKEAIKLCEEMNWNFEVINLN